MHWLDAVLSGRAALTIPTWGRRELEADWGFRRRTVACHVIYYVVKGGLRCRHGFNEYPLGARDLLWIPPGVTHDLNSTVAGTTAYFMRVDVASPGELDQGERVLTGHAPQAPQWFEAISPLFQKEGQNPHRARRLHCLVGLLYSEISGEGTRGMENGAQPDAKGVAISRPIERALAWGRTAAAHELSPAGLAQVAGLSADRFSRALAKATGLPARLWVVSERLRRSQALLLESRSPIGEVARQCGWDNPLLFSRLFSQNYGMSPRAWRQGNG